MPTLFRMHGFLFLSCVDLFCILLLKASWSLMMSSTPSVATAIAVRTYTKVVFRIYVSSTISSDQLS